MSCPYYTFKSGDYHCVKQQKDVNSDIYFKYCRNYDYSDCPIYKNESSSGGCFLTSACTAARGLPDDCYELQTLRAFRDGWLKQQPDGEALIAEYYEAAPKIVKAIDFRDDRLKVYDEIYETLVKPCVELIEKQDYQQAKLVYQAKTLQLALQYMQWHYS